MSDELLWTGWRGPLRVLLMGVMSYVFLIALLRITGKRTLSKMNAFDLILTVATGSTFASVLLNDSISFAEGATAFLVLTMMQFVVAWASVRSERVEAIVKSRPTILVWRGEMLLGPMKQARVTRAEVLAACRESGVLSMSEVEAVVLETSGEFSLLRRPERPAPAGKNTLCGTGNFPPRGSSSAIEAGAGT